MKVAVCAKLPPPSRLSQRVLNSAVDSNKPSSTTMATTTPETEEVCDLFKFYVLRTTNWLELQRLKSALWYSVGQIIDHDTLTSNTNATPQFIVALMEMVWMQIGTFLLASSFSYKVSYPRCRKFSQRPRGFRETCRQNSNQCRWCTVVSQEERGTGVFITRVSGRVEKGQHWYKKSEKSEVIEYRDGTYQLASEMKTWIRWGLHGKAFHNLVRMMVHLF